MKILFIDRSIQAESIFDIANLPCGGRKTSMFYLPDELGKMGHDCWVWANIKKPGITACGTKWVAERPPDDVDVLVLNRGIGDGCPEIKAKLRVFWTHDLPHNGFVPDPRTLNAVGLTVFMSRYAKAVWSEFFRGFGKSVIIPNGVDKKIFEPDEKCGNTLVFASAPNRGLKRLPLIYEAAKARLNGQNLKMQVFSNMGKLHPGEVDDPESDGYELTYKNVEESGIELMDPVPQAQLSFYLSQAAATVIPTGFPEICSNLVLQSLACGTPVITTGGIGATPEWVKDFHNGLMTRFKPEDYMVHTVEMVRNIVRFMGDKKLRSRLTRNASRASNVLDWAEIALMWNKAIRRAI